MYRGDESDPRDAHQVKFTFKSIKFDCFNLQINTLIVLTAVVFFSDTV